MKNLDTPILFIIFNRPDLTRIVFEKIQQIKPSKLYISCDGPRLHINNEDILVNEARNITKLIDWNCDLKTSFSDVNLGCKLSVSSAINWFFENEEFGIILEDDCLPSLDFFHFCDSLLLKYKYNTNLFAITGCNFQKIKEVDSSYFFTNYTHIWGWATWRRAWKFNDLNISFWPKWKYSNDWNHRFSNEAEKKYWENLFDLTYNNKIDTWDYSWVASIWYNNGFSIYPNMNLISNIGFRNDATHTKFHNKVLANKKHEAYPSLKHPKNIIINNIADKFTFDEIYQGKQLRFPQKYYFKIKSFFAKLYLKLFSNNFL